MELIAPPKKRVFSEKNYKNVVDKIFTVLKNSPGDEDVKRAIMEFYGTYADVRYRNLELRESWDMRGEMGKIKDRFPDKIKDVENLASILHFELRDQIDFALRFPIYYMDVHPIDLSDPDKGENMGSLYESICSRNADVYRNLKPNIRDAIKKFIIPKISEIGVDCKNRAANPKINLKIRDYEKKLAENIFDKLPKLKNIDKTSVDFVFDCSRRINYFPKELDAYGIDFAKFAGMVGWYEENVPNNLIEAYNRVMYKNQKIVDWLYGDVVVYVLELIQRNKIKTKISIWIPFYSLTTCSYLFGRIGSLTCDMNVKLIFNRLSGVVFKYIKDIQDIDVNEIQSILAAYFETSHEIWRANIPPNTNKTPVLLDEKSLEIGDISPLYRAIKVCFSEAFASDEIISKKPLEEIAADEYIETFMKSIKIKPSEFPKLKILVAGPGTGKSTYSGIYNVDYVVVDLDDIQRKLRTYEKDMNEEHLQIISGIVEKHINANYPILRKVLERTLFINNKNLRLSGLENLAKKCLSKLLRLCLKAKYNVCLETPGVEVNKKNIYDTCGKIKSLENEGAQNFYNDWCGEGKFKCKVVILYLPFINQYNQQLFRYLDEQRLGRYYKIKLRNIDMWQGPQNFGSEDIDIFMYGPNLEQVVKNGIIINTEIIKKIKDQEFKEFLIKHFKP